MNVPPELDTTSKITATNQKWKIYFVYGYVFVTNCTQIYSFTFAELIPQMQI